MYSTCLIWKHLLSLHPAPRNDSCLRYKQRGLKFRVRCSSTTEVPDLMAVPSSFPAVKKNLDEILADPSRDLDTLSIEKLKLEITESTDPTVPATLLSQIAQVLPVLQEDPTPITTLGIKAATFVGFSDLQAIKPPVDLIAGIKAPSPPVNLLALDLLGKAGRAPGDAAIVAGNSALVASLVELWLTTSNTDVAQAAFDVLWSLLQVDYSGIETDGEKGSKASGQGLVWRRVFADRDVYGLLFSNCSLTAGTSSKLSSRDRSVAQGRLMEFVAKAGALRWDVVSSSHIPEIESVYGADSLLHFAACCMVDTRDVLMRMTQLNFFRELIQIGAPGLSPGNSSVHSSQALDFLVGQKVHQQILEYFLDPSQMDPIDAQFLSNPVMAYVSQYAQLYPNHLLSFSRDILNRMLTRIYQSFQISSAQWMQHSAPIGELTVLGSLPRILLLNAPSHVNPLHSVPTNVARKECLDTLSRIFHGPAESSESMTNNATDAYKEAVAARILYFTFINDRQNFWQDVSNTADMVALADVALSAIGLIKAVVTANWKTLSDEDAKRTVESSPYKLPSENELLSRTASSTQGILPTTGPWALLTPPALTTVLPYLFKPPRSYHEFVSGGAGDTESNVWRVATAKYDALVALHDALRGSTVQVESSEDILRTLAQRVRQGPMGLASQVGNRVETLGA